MEVHEGPNRWRIEEDLIHITQVGEATEPLIQISLRLMNQILEHYEYVFVSADARLLTGADAAARRAMSTYENIKRIGGTVTFGASLPVRTILSLLFHGTRLLGRASFLSYYPKTEAEGLIWIQEQRKKVGQRRREPGQIR